MKFFIAINIILLNLLFSFSVQSGETINVVTEDWRPWSYEENGIVKGRSTEVVKAVMDRTGLEYSINVLPWARAFKYASTRPDVLIYALGWTPERERNFKLVGKVTPSNNAYLYRLKTRNDIVINTLSDAKKYTIFANNKSATHTMLINNGFEKIVSGWHQKISVEMLLRGRIDLLVLTEKKFRTDI